MVGSRTAKVIMAFSDKADLVRYQPTTLGGRLHVCMPYPKCPWVESCTATFLNYELYGTIVFLYFYNDNPPIISYLHPTIMFQVNFNTHPHTYM